MVFYIIYILIIYLVYILIIFLVYILAFHLAAEVQRYPLRLEGSWLRSSNAHCIQKLAVEVQSCPFRSEAGKWGPGVPTARGNWRRDWRRIGKAEVDVEVEVEIMKEEEDEEKGEEKEEEKEEDPE